MASTTTIQPVFTVNERVLCYHGPLIYEAKVLKSHNHDETTTPSGQVGPHYFVHYKGWKQTYVLCCLLVFFLETGEPSVGLCVRRVLFPFDLPFSYFKTVSTTPRHVTNISLVKCRWDEWVPASRLLKMTETNVALQKSLQHTNAPSAHGGAASAKINTKNTGVKDNVSTRAGARKDGTRGTKRSREDVRLFLLSSDISDAYIAIRFGF